MSQIMSRIITFSSTLRLPGAIVSTKQLGDMNISAYPQIASVSGSNLVHGSVYEFDISFKDVRTMMRTYNSL